MVKTVCQPLVSSWPSFLGEKSYKPIVITDVGPIQWYEQSAVKKGRDNWSWIITMGDFLEIVGCAWALTDTLTITRIRITKSPEK